MDKLLRLHQKDMTLEEYKWKMELYIMRLSIREEVFTTIVRLMSGLSITIRDVVRLLPYKNLNELVQQCIKVKQQNLRKGLDRSSHFDSLKFLYLRYIKVRFILKNSNCKMTCTIIHLKLFKHIKV